MTVAGKHLVLRLISAAQEVDLDLCICRLGAFKRKSFSTGDVGDYSPHGALELVATAFRPSVNPIDF
jgi:hypothetical protein